MKIRKKTTRKYRKRVALISYFLCLGVGFYTLFFNEKISPKDIEELKVKLSENPIIGESGGKQKVKYLLFETEEYPNCSFTARGNSYHWLKRQVGVLKEGSILSIGIKKKASLKLKKKDNKLWHCQIEILGMKSKGQVLLSVHQTNKWRTDNTGSLLLIGLGVFGIFYSIYFLK